MKYKKEDFEVLYTRGSGPGGQHRNKVETACEVRHLPTGMKQRCESSRSKLTNYQTALKMLLTRLQAQEEAAHHARLNQVRVSACFDQSQGSKVIRTYNFQRQEVKNHATGKVAPLKRVLNGEIELVQ